MLVTFGKYCLKTGGIVLQIWSLSWVVMRNFSLYYIKPKILWNIAWIVESKLII